jgi:micrococcal nuclease
LSSLILGWWGWHGRLDPRCNRAYPDLCLPSPPPKLGCGQIAAQNFRVYLPVHPDKPWGLRQFDPHGLDTDGDGIGCESAGSLAEI